MVRKQISKLSEFLITIASYVYDPVNCFLTLRKYAESRTAQPDSFLMKLYQEIEAKITGSAEFKRDFTGDKDVMTSPSASTKYRSITLLLRNNKTIKQVFHFICDLNKLMCNGYYFLLVFLLHAVS